MLFLLLFIAFSALGQTSHQHGSGAPSAGQCNTARMYGRVYDDVSVDPPVEYTCGSGGWKVTSGSGGGSFVLVEQHTASSSASLAFTTCISSTYDDYQIRVVNLIPQTTDTTVKIQFSTDGGMTYDTGNNYVYAVADYNQGNTSGFNGSAADSGISLFAGLGTSASWSLNGSYQATGFNASLFPAVIGGGAALSNDTNFYRYDTAGAWKSTTAVNAFRIIMSSGNIASGTVRCYGLAK